MLRKIGEYFFENGESVEYFYCSSDATSLDGVGLPEHNIAIVDGTAPHTMEAHLPSVTAKIYNLGECIGDDIIKHHDILQELAKEKQSLYASIYKYLAIAKESMLCCQPYFDINHSLGQELLKKLDPKPFASTGSLRHLFLNYWNTKSKSSLAKMNNFSKTYYLDDNIFSIDANMQFLADAMSKKGYDVILFHNTILPDLVSSLYLPQLNIFINSREKDTFKSSQTALHLQVSNEYQKLVSKTLARTKTVHKEIEKYYIQNVDFDELNRITAKIIGNIENRIECNS